MPLMSAGAVVVVVQEDMYMMIITGRKLWGSQAPPVNRGACR